MMIGDPHHQYYGLTHNSTVYNPPWDPTATIAPSSSSSSSPTPPSPLSVMTSANGSSSPASPPTVNGYFLSSHNNEALLTALSRYLPSNETEQDSPEMDDGYAKSDEFRMYEFKVRMCTRLKAHDWTDCPFAHPGEKARRRDPRRYSYSGTACTDFRKGSCRRGDACEFAHGVFECWLHPTRYRTQACKDGRNCTRRVCFFAHAPDQLRVILGEPSPRSIGSGSDPFEDADPTGQSYGSSALHELVASIRNLQLSKVKSMQARPSWNFPVGVGAGSPGRFGSSGGSVVRPGFFSLPTTPTRPLGSEYLDAWEKEQEPTMERVESGRELRARMFEKLSKENPLSVSDPGESATSAPGSGPDVGWVTDLVN